MTNLNPYLSFNGNCREAMEYYKSCLGGELTFDVIGDSPMAAQMPPEAKDNIMHSILKTDSMTLMASDMMSGEEVTRGNGMTLALSGDDKEAIKGYYAKLSEGGKVEHELKEEFFGLYGDLVDKYGVRWMFQAEAPKE